MNTLSIQRRLFADPVSGRVGRAETASTFIDNMSLPVHRWFRFSAGFSAEWVQRTILALGIETPNILDPFAGSATTLLAAEAVGTSAIGLEAHPMIARIAQAKLAWRSDPEAYLAKVKKIRQASFAITPEIETYSPLIRKCYDDNTLGKLDALRIACEQAQEGSDADKLAWLTLLSILRQVSPVGTAQWQYVLPKKRKANAADVYEAFDKACQMFLVDMTSGQTLTGKCAQLIHGDARDCAGVPTAWADAVITSPPYPNNYDYADATRLELCFMKEISGWGDLQGKIRNRLVCSCSQHVPERSVDIDALLASTELMPIREELTEVVRQLAQIRLTKGGKKTYHLMVARYFQDLAKVWLALRRCCRKPSTVCFVIGDSAPYGVYVPVIPWLGSLAMAAGFRSYRFEKTRDRNVKWKNRKHRVPLQEGLLWVEG